jgi:gliding motility-associated-like protein
LDSDNDGIVDKIEAVWSISSSPQSPSEDQPLDTDKDGTADFRDLDSDNDGILDQIEAIPLAPNQAGDKFPADTDQDGTADYRDLDSDDDCILDSIESNADLDRDSYPNYRDKDSDGDGISDSFEAIKCGNPVDSDKDGIADFFDTDSDNDGIHDRIEAADSQFAIAIGQEITAGRAATELFVLPKDTDGDLIYDYLDADSDNDNISDEEEKGKTGIVPVDTDKDSMPDYRDLDSDNDGILDKLEDLLNYGDFVDCDKDGIPNYIDSDECEPLLRQGISPNGDNVNDVLVVPGVLSYKNKITIFNRWGSIVFEQENYENNWGGDANRTYDPSNYSGSLPDGMYYYIVDYYGVKPTVGTFIFVNRQL